ncbi:3'-5' exonuclease [Nocardia fluminea]|uniref:Exonuclease n=1 Tax=Nocardia fluminea TaxID=134984 RepID=A0A2N3VGY5_9NOCA|nr:exonuclease domain-containing protein [Nocardia fluminea]PKV80863.1 exonuclease [Nocardia fluminea]
MSVPIVFLDTETTGLHADRRPWEIGIIRRDEHGQTETTIQVADVDLSGAELIGLKIGRFHDRHLHYGEADADAHEKDDGHLLLEERDAAREVEHLTRGAHIVGAVPSFDTECLAAMLRRHRLVPAWHYHLIDIEALAAGYLRGRHEMALPLPWNSDDLSRAVGVSTTEDERHTAMGDARWAMRVYDAVAGSAQ